ncbi:hypothetical protein SAMN05421721_10197 [Ectothiorhodospira mobilis]|uniref:Tetratricopeptide repeat-containing protein n=1 Tax=Ectothiorhodospira mobilis TaxID=195064 RepID=A0A1I4P9L3_ECTMO|nr:hypothetical protein [Ectothiorhodospira mobilis]SFM24472.1 hypothetical protein SAMN05421721_10197 [Ectothiorhodospira mobilis]
MMRGVILGAVLLLAGCAPITASMDLSPAEAVRRAVERQDYGRAREILRRQEARGEAALPRSQAVHVQRLAAALEQAMLLQAAGHLRRGEWAAAEAAYRRGLACCPDSRALAAARDRAREEQAARLQALHMRLLLARGRHLARLAGLYPQWLRLAPQDAAARREWEMVRAQVGPMAQALTRLGARALAEDAPFLAVESLELARALAPGEAAERRLQAARAAREDRLQALQERRRAEAESQGRARLAALRGALAAGELMGARRHLQALAADPPAGADLEALRADLERAVTARMESGLEAGRRHYLAGRIREALAVWRGLQRLRPGDAELAAHVRRAERALESLRALEGMSVPAEEAPGDAKAGDIGAQGRTQGGEQEHQQDP